MRSFFGICVLSALAAVGTTQLTHNSPHYDAEQTQHLMQPEHHMSQPEHQMSQQEHHASRPEHHMSEPEYYPRQPQHHTEHNSQPNHYMIQAQHGYESWPNVEAEPHAQSQSTWISPEHQMSQQEHHASRPEHHMSEPEHHPRQPQPHTEHHSQPNHYMSQAQHGYESWSKAEAHAQSQSTWISPEHQMSQQEHHASQPEHHMSEPEHHPRQPQHHTEHHSQSTWISPEQPPYQPVEILSQPHIVHSQPLPIDPPFELNPYPYQHPHYPPIGSHHSQDTGLLYPKHGWNMQNPTVYQHPEATAPEHPIKSLKEDYPNQSSAFVTAVASSNSVPITNHEPASPQRFKIITIPKVDEGADYNLPVADHEMRQPRVIHASNDGDLPDIVKEILAKLKHMPIKIKPEPKTDNAPTPKERKPEGSGPVHRSNKHKKQKVTTIPVVMNQNSKTKAVAVAKTDTDKKYTIITGGKHSTATKASRKHKHKHSHKKLLKPLLDPELLAKELRLLSKELWVPSPDKTHEKDDRTNPDDADCDDEGSNTLDKNKPKDKHHHEKHSDPHISAVTTLEKDKPTEKTTTASPYIEPDKKDQKDADEDEDWDTKNIHSKPEDNKENTKIITDRVQIEKVQKKVTSKVETKNENRDRSEKQNSNNDQNWVEEGNDWVSPSPVKTTEPCDDENDPKKENEKKEHVLIQKTDKKTKHGSDKTKPKETISQKLLGKDIAKTTTPSSNVKPGDQKDCDSANSHETTEPCGTENEQQEEDTTRKHLQKPKTHRHNTYNKGNTNIITDHVQTEKVQKEVTSKLETKNENRDRSEKQNSNNDQNWVEEGNDWVSPSPVKTTEPCDDENDPKKENEKKEHVLIQKTDKKPKHGSDKTKPKETISQKLLGKDIAKTTTPSSNVKPGDQKDCDSANSHETTEPCGSENEQQEEDTTRKHLQKPKTHRHNTYNKGNTNIITDHVQTEKVQKEVTSKLETKNENRDRSEKQNSNNDQNWVEEGNDWVSPSPVKTTEPCDDENDPKKENEKKEHVLIQKTDKKPKHGSDKTKPKETISQKLLGKDIAKTTTPSSNVKPGDQKDCDSANSHETTEPCGTENEQQEEDTTRKHLQKPKTHRHNTYNKGNTKIITDHVQTEKVQKEVTSKVETKNENRDRSEKQNSNNDQNWVEEGNDWVSPSPVKTTEPCDDENDPKKENEKKEHVLIQKTDKKPKHGSDKTKPKETISQKLLGKDIAKTTTPSSNVKPGDQKDCDSANSHETTEPCGTENEQQEEDTTRKHLQKPKTHRHNTYNKGNTNIITDHVQTEKVQKEVTSKVETKNENRDLSEKQNSNNDQNWVEEGNDWVSPSPVKTTEPCDDENDPKKENEKKEHVLIQKTDKKPKHGSDKTKPKETISQKLLGKYIAKTTTPSSNVKPGDQKDCDSANSHETTEPCGSENEQQEENTTRKHLQKPKTHRHNTYNKGNTNIITDHVQTEKVQKEVTSKVETKNENRDRSEKQNSNNDQNWVEEGNDWVSPSPVKTTEPCDDENDPKKENEKKEHVLIQKTDKKPKHGSDKTKPKETISQKLLGKDIAKTTTPSSNVKPSDQKDCDSANSHETTEPCGTENEQQEEDTTRKHLQKPKWHRHNTYNEGNTKIITDHVQIEKVQKEVTSKVETKNEPTEPCDDEKDSKKENEKKEHVPKQKTDEKPKHGSDQTKPKETVSQKLLGKDIAKTITPSSNVKPGDQIDAGGNDCDSANSDETTEPCDTENEQQDYYPPANSDETSESFVTEHAPKKKDTTNEKYTATEPLPKGNEDSKDRTKEKKIGEKIEVVETKTKKSMKDVVSSEAANKPKPIKTSNENSDIDNCDSADPESDPKQDKTTIIKENNYAKKEKTKEVTKNQATIAKNKADGKASREELTSYDVAEILEKSETDEPLTTVGFLFSLISHALQGSGSVEQMFEEPKVKTFMKDMIRLFHVSTKPKE